MTTTEVAAAVVLLCGSVLFGRSYSALLAIDMGFDGANVFELGFTYPPQMYNELDDLAQRIVSKIRTVSGVVAAVRQTAPPINQSPSRVTLIVDGQASAAPELFAVVEMSPQFFDVLRIPLRLGRFFEASEPATSVLVPEDVAARLWPGINPVGHQLQVGANKQPYEVVGVVGRIRNERDGTPAGPYYSYIYRARQPRAPRPLATPEQIRGWAAGGVTMFSNVMVRLDGTARIADVAAAARSVDPRFKIDVESVDDKYARMFADKRFAAASISVFGVITCIVATFGIYGVLSHLIVSRTREIGIRIALGADRRRIGTLVVGSSLRFVLAGAALGLLAAMLLARTVQSQLYGVSAADPVTYTMVVTAVIAVSLIATWQPARAAAHIDPAITLRAE